MGDDTCLCRIVLVGAIFFTHALTAGFSFSFGVFYLPLMDTFGSGSSFTAWIASINLGMLCGLGPVAGIIINKCGCQLALILGGLISALGLLATYFATNIYFVFATFGIVSGIGYSITFATGVVAVNLYFDRHRPLVMGITMAGLSAGSFINPNLVNFLIEHYTWRGTLLIYSALSLNVCAFALLFNKRRMKQRTNVENVKSCIAPVGRQRKLCSLDGVILMLNCLTYSFGMTIVMTYISPLAFVRGHSPRVSALVLSSLGLANLFGRVLMGLVCDIKSVDVVVLYMSSYLLAGLAALFVALWNSLVPIIMGAVIFGLFSAACGPVLAEVTLHVFGLSNFAKSYGFLLATMGIGFTSGGPAAGFLLEQTGIYAHVFFLAGGAYILSSLLMCGTKLNECQNAEETIPPETIELTVSSV